MGSRFVECSTNAIAEQSLPTYVSTDNDPLFRFHRWLANLRILGIEEIKTVPFVPESQSFLSSSFFFSLGYLLV